MATEQPELLPTTEADVIALLGALAEAEAAADQASLALEEARGANRKAVAERTRRSRQVVQAYRQVRDTTAQGQAAFQDHLAQELEQLLARTEDVPPADEAEGSEGE